MIISNIAFVIWVISCAVISFSNPEMTRATIALEYWHFHTLGFIIVMSIAFAEYKYLSWKDEKEFQKRKRRGR